MDVHKAIDDYINWLKSEIKVTAFGEYYELTTPFLDRFNDYIQIYVKQDTNGKFTLTDDGYIISNLLSSGISIRQDSKRAKILDGILRNHYLTLDGDAITTTATKQDYPCRKHLLLHALLRIDDMFELRSDQVKDVFIEDVQSFFDKNEIYYTKNFPILGKTGNLYNYDFHFQKSKHTPERYCKIINKFRADKRDITIFNWIGTKEMREDSGKLIVLLNDENPINPMDIDTLVSYEIEPVLYSERDKKIDLFKAA